MFRPNCPLKFYVYLHSDKSYIFLIRIECFYILILANWPKMMSYSCFCFFSLISNKFEAFLISTDFLFLSYANSLAICVCGG